MELYIEKSKLVQVFNEQVDYSTDLFGGFGTGKNKYLGQVSEDGFVLKRYRNLFVSRIPIAKATGTFSQRGQLTIIETQIDGRHPLIIFGLVLILAVGAIFIADIVLRRDWASPLLPGILVYIAIVFSTFYLLMRCSVSRLKKDLEREMREWVK